MFLVKNLKSESSFLNIIIKNNIKPINKILSANFHKNNDKIIDKNLLLLTKKHLYNKKNDDIGNYNLCKN